MQYLYHDGRGKSNLARVLVIEPQILHLDEPFCALDMKGGGKNAQLHDEPEKKLGITVLHVTHDIEDVRTLATTHVVVIHDG